MKSAAGERLARLIEFDRMGEQARADRAALQRQAEAALNREQIEVVIHLNGREANYHSPIEVIADGHGTWEASRFLSEEPADKGGKRYVYSQHTVTVYP